MWGVMSVKETDGLFFLPPGTTVNNSEYLKLLKNKLELHMVVHQCTIFIQDGASYHKLKILGNGSFVESLRHQIKNARFEKNTPATF